MKNVVAISFDFDDTLAPDSTTGFLKSIGVDTDRFWKDVNQRIIDEGWDPIPVYLFEMVARAHDPELRRFITAEAFREWGRRLPLYEGVESFFERIREAVKQIDSSISVEFYIISSGIGEILRNSPIAKHFKMIWANEFVYDSDGVIRFPKNIVSFTEKTRFLFHISKGSIDASRSNPAVVNEKVGDFEVPFDRMIYIGDGMTDVPCFKLISRYGGISLAVMHEKRRHKWEQAWGLVVDQRVNSLHPADYREGGGLEQEILRSIRGMLSS